MSFSRPVPTVVLLVTLLAAPTACGAGSESSPDGGSQLADGSGDRADAAVWSGGFAPGGFAPARIGMVQVLELAGGTGGTLGTGFGQPVAAWFFDRARQPYPELIATEGDCAVYGLPPEVFCDNCNQMCTADGMCEPFPTPSSVGQIQVTGGTVPLAMTSNGGFYEVSPYLEPDEDLFAAGDAIRIAAEGAELPAFDVTLTGVPPLVADVPAAIARGDEVTFAWQQANEGRIQLALLVGHHGMGFDGLLICDTADDGELVVSSALTAAMPARISNYGEPHTSHLARIDRTLIDTTAGPVEVIVGSQVGFYAFSE